MESTEQRKARLKALRDEAVGSDEGNIDNKRNKPEESSAVSETVLKFRSYQPRDESLKDKQLQPAAAPSIQKEAEARMASVPDVANTEVGLANLAPRKVDWDLKRDIAKKLEKLEKRTQRALVEILREKLVSKEVNAV